MSDVIELRDLRVSAIVGVLIEERVRPQELSLDLDLVRSFERAAASDDLVETTNYAEVLSAAARVATTGKFQLLETLAHEVAETVLGLDGSITEVTVAVRKLRAPVPELVGTVGVRVVRRRDP